MVGSVERDVTALETLSPAQLRQCWIKVTDTAVPKVSPSLLRLALAWELQAHAYGGLSRRTRQRLDQLAAARTRTSQVLPGMRLIREWKGVVHVVTIGDDGTIRWNGRTWKSLSQVARTITGTRWSGPAFFGLKQRVAA